MNIRQTKTVRTIHALRLLLISAFLLLIAAGPAAAHPLTTTGAATTTTVTVQLIAVQDIGVIESAPTFTGGGYPYFVLNARPGGDYDHNFIGFDLSVLPVDATIDSAELRLEITGFGGPPLNVEGGRVDGPWDETINWNTQPPITWRGQGTTVSAAGQASWPLTQLVRGWYDGSVANYGVALRGTNSNGAGVRANTRDAAGTPPILAVTYTLAEDNSPRPDLGDAPDSSNHHNVVNTAYPAAGVSGRFPTVWDVPADQPAGPRHLNATMEGWLGQVISREPEADQGPDQDGANNILRRAGGVIADVADNDRGDDGWRNRDVRFFDCERQTLTVRVSKAPNADRNFMYLNVWFDGNEDGDWEDVNPCRPDETGPNQASYEWIVQDYLIDMNAIPAGGYRDFNVNTELVYNAAQRNGHWLRFTLSESRAVEPNDRAYPDGRGPHPTASPNSFSFGETEDIYQRPPQPTAEPGTLVLRKRVITGGEPVDYAGTVTYEIALKQEGGTGPIQARIRDVLQYPQHALPQITDSGQIAYVEVTTPTGGAAPLQADLGYDTDSSPISQVISWQGTLDPDAEIRLTFDVHVHPLCSANQQTTTVRNVAQARPRNGDAIETVVEFEAKCPGYNISQLQLRRTVLDVDGTVLSGDGRANAAGVDAVQRAVVIPGRTYVLRTTVTNPFADGITLNWTGCLTCTLAAGVDGRVGDGVQPATTVPAGATVSFDRKLAVPAQADESVLTEQAQSFDLQESFCLVTDNTPAGVCPDTAQFPNLVGQAPELHIEVRPSDLGDAPDSTNHFGAAMAAYPGQPADFPTVFDPATGAIQGPLHRNPRPLHLGRRVSREAEADLGPDEDPTNNIVPPANVADLDRGDDGVRPGQLVAAFASCQPATFQARIFIHPALLNAMIQAGRQNVYINSWIDANQNGNWADERPCAAGPAPEHIVVDFPVPLASLAGGLNTVNVATTGPVPWDGTADAWFRIMLSEEPSVKLAGKPYGDGRGPATGYRTGETEDTLLHPQGGPGDGPDIALGLSYHLREVAQPAPDIQGAALDAGGQQLTARFKLDYANRGSQPANGALLEFQIPEKLRDGDFYMKIPDIDGESVRQSPEAIVFPLPDLAPGDAGTIVLGWTGCLTCTVAAEIGAVSTDVVVVATLDGDVDLSNNRASVTLGAPARPARIAFLVPSTATVYPYRSALTCSESTTIMGSGWEAGSLLTVRVNGAEHGTVTPDADGGFVYALALADGRYDIAVHKAGDSATGQSLRLRQARGLSLEPMSLRIVGPNGLVVMPDPGFFMPHAGTSLDLPGGGAYDVLVNSCAGVPVNAVEVQLDDSSSRAHSATDCEPRGSDACGPWRAKLSVPEAVHAAGLDGATAGVHQLQLRVITDHTSETVAGVLTVAAAGTVRDAATGQPLQDAVVTLLQVVGDAAQAVWEGTGLGQVNPQTTGAGGQYLFTGPEGTLRLTVTRRGYQPYTTADFAADGRLLTQDIGLTPDVSGAPTHLIALTDQSFVPGLLTVAPGSVIEFVNLNLAEHTVSGDGWDSGLLAAGESYRVKLDQPGSVTFGDDAAATSAVVVVDPNADDPGDPGRDGSKVYLPLVVNR